MCVSGAGVLCQLSTTMLSHLTAEPVWGGVKDAEIASTLVGFSGGQASWTNKSILSPGQRPVGFQMPFVGGLAWGGVGGDLEHHHQRSRSERDLCLQQLRAANAADRLPDCDLAVSAMKRDEPCRQHTSAVPQRCLGGVLLL